MCICVPEHMCVHCARWNQWRSEKGLASPGAGVKSCLWITVCVWRTEPRLSARAASEPSLHPVPYFLMTEKNEPWDLSPGAKAWDGAQQDESSSPVTLLDWTQCPVAQSPVLSVWSWPDHLDIFYVIIPHLVLVPCGCVVRSWGERLGHLGSQLDTVCRCPVFAHCGVWSLAAPLLKGFG